MIHEHFDFEFFKNSNFLRPLGLKDVILYGTSIEEITLFLKERERQVYLSILIN